MLKKAIWPLIFIAFLFEGALSPNWVQADLGRGRRFLMERVDFLFSSNEEEEIGKASTTVSPEIDINQDVWEKVAESTFGIVEELNDKSRISHNPTLVLLILRAMAKIGEYELSHRELMMLMNALNKFQRKELDPKLVLILKQIERIKFGKKRGQYFVRFYAKNRRKGIVVPIEQEDFKQGFVRKIIIEDTCELYFKEASTGRDRRSIRKFVKEPVRLLGIFQTQADRLDKIHPAVRDNIDDYLEEDEIAGGPVFVGLKNVKGEVDTTTIFGQAMFHFDRAIILPGIESEDGVIPNLVVGGHSYLLKLKMSVEE